MRPKEKLKRENTEQLKYESLKEMHVSDLEKITKLQDQVIRLTELVVTERNKRIELLEEKLRKVKK